MTEEQRDNLREMLSARLRALDGRRPNIELIRKEHFRIEHENCPRCSGMPATTRTWLIKWKYRTECSLCGLRTDWFATPEDANMIWNAIVQQGRQQQAFIALRRASLLSWDHGNQHTENPDGSS